MADFEFLAKLRAAGVKSATLNAHEQVTSVEFFPRDLLDVGTIFPPSDVDGAPTERPPAPPISEGEEEPAPMKVAPALARLLRNGSVS